MGEQMLVVCLCPVIPYEIRSAPCRRNSDFRFPARLEGIAAVIHLAAGHWHATGVLEKGNHL